MEANGVQFNEEVIDILSVLNLMRPVLTPEEILDVELSPCSPEEMLGLDPMEPVGHEVGEDGDDFSFSFSVLLTYSFKTMKEMMMPIVSHL